MKGYYGIFTLYYKLKYKQLLVCMFAITNYPCLQQVRTHGCLLLFFKIHFIFESGIETPQALFLCVHTFYK